MNSKLKSFLIGLTLIAIIVAGVFLVVLTYSANEQTTVETYIFQMDNRPQDRVGPLQNVDNMTPENLRDKLIQKYVADYFKVIPGTITSEQNETVMLLSTDAVYNKWLDSEAKNIEDMAKNKMFRNVWISPEYIRPAEVNGTSGLFEVPYTMRTWVKSNDMNADIENESGTLYLRIIFEPGIRQDINIRQHLKDGESPVGLFKFMVIDVQ